MVKESLNINELAWDKMNGLLPAIVQHYQTGDVLMLGYMNKPALEQTLSSQHVTFYSRSKQRLWVKGETSGNVLELVEIFPDCDQDTLLVRAKPTGPVCHLGFSNCFQTELKKHSDTALNLLSELEFVIEDRKKNRPEKSYLTYLFNKGIERMAQKVGEEGVEVALAAVARDKAALCDEMADLLFHMLVLLHAKDLNINQILAVLARRRKGRSTTP